MRAYRTVRAVRPGRRGFRSLDRAGSATDAWLGSQELAKALRPHMAKVHWAEVVGAQVASVTQIESVKDGVLTVRVKNSSWCLELTLLREDMLRRLNLKLGGRVLRDIQFKGGGLLPVVKEPDPEAPILPTADDLAGILPSPEALARADRTVRGIEDPDLRERLRATLLRVARLEEWKREHGWLPCARCTSLTPTGGFDDVPLCDVCRTVGRYPDRRQQSG